MAQDGESAAREPGQGTQVIDRAVFLLRSIAQSGGSARLTDLARAADLATPTARRILKRLVDHGMAGQDPETQRYHLGMLAYELGLAASHRVDVAARLKPLMQRLAELSGDTAYLVMRQDFEVVCIDRVEGNYPIKTLTLKVGDRYPLGITAGSLALLGALPKAEADAIVEANRNAYSERGHLTVEQLRDDLEKTRQRGYALRRDAITDGSIGIGLAVPNGSLPPYAAISLAMVLERMTDSRRGQLLTMMRSELDAIAGKRDRS